MLQRSGSLVAAALCTVMLVVPGCGSSASGSGCDPSYPDVCLQSEASDYDCEGGEGDGPRYVSGPIRVESPDPFDLDRDGDGTGCDAYP
jgi:hypothetical protein